MMASLRVLEQADSSLHIATPPPGSIRRGSPISSELAFVLPQRLQVHTVRCRSSSQPLCHWCLRTRQISRAFITPTFRRMNATQKTSGLYMKPERHHLIPGSHCRESVTPR